MLLDDVQRLLNSDFRADRRVRCMPMLYTAVSNAIIACVREMGTCVAPARRASTNSLEHESLCDMEHSSSTIRSVKERFAVGEDSRTHACSSTNDALCSLYLVRSYIYLVRVHILVLLYTRYIQGTK